MSLIQQIKDWFRKGGAKLGMVKSLTNITDDDRVSIDPMEYERIKLAKLYYKDDLPKVKYRNSYGEYRQRPLSSLNVTKLASKKLASIIFNEQCSLSLEDETTNEFINEVVKDNKFNMRFEQRLETAIALGGLAARPYVDDNDVIRIAWANADQFYPLRNNTDDISECAFASRTVRTENDRNVYYTLLEFHEWDDAKTYHITNELYRSYQSDVIGEQVALETLYPNLASELTFTDVITKPLFAYFRTPGANNKNLDSPLGVGIVDNSRNVIDAINRTHDMFVHEVRMGKRRIAVPAEMLKPTGNLYGDEVDDAHPVLFDKDEDVYQGMYGDTDKLNVTDLTSDIRSSQFKESIDYFLREFEQQIGFSSGTFSYDGQGVKTATEVVSENSATYQTRSSYLTQVELFLNQLVNAILEVASVGQFFSDGKPRWTGNVADVELSIHFDDGVFIDKDKQRADEMQLVAAGIMPKLEYLKRNFGLSEEDAQKWLAQVTNEQPDFSQGSFQEPIDGDSNEV